MNSLLIFPVNENDYDQPELFDKEKVVEDLSSIEGVYDLRQEGLVGSVCVCCYDFNGYSAIVRLSGDLKTISLKPENDASLQMALELQRHETRPLRVVNDGYDFDLILKDLKSLEDFQERIKNEISLQAA